MPTIRPYKTLVTPVCQLVDDDGNVKAEITLTNQGQPYEIFQVDELAVLTADVVAQAQAQMDGSVDAATRTLEAVTGG